MSPSSAFPRVLALMVSLGIVVTGCGSSDAGVRGCTVDADCGGGWCQDGSCQSAYTLTLTTTPAPGADARVHVNGTVRLRVQVTSGGGSGPASVTLSFVDEGRLQSVGPPDYAYAWDTTTSNEGSHRVKATVAAGSRTYESQVVEVVVDRTAPAAPQVVAPRRFLNTPTVVLEGSASEGGTLRIHEGPAVVATREVQTSGSWTIDLPGLPEGAHSASAAITDLAGNESVRTTIPTFTLDVTPPAPPVLDAIAPVIGSGNLSVTGTAEPDGTVVLFDQGTALQPTALVQTDRTWSIPVTLTNGGHVLTATVADLAGNVSGSSLASSFTVSPSPVTISGPSLTNADPVVVHGTAPAGSDVQVLDGSTALTTVRVASDSSWQASLVLREGEHDISARVGTLAPARLNVVVDRTNLGIDAQLPAPGSAAAANVDWRSPITVRFKEAMAVGTLTNPANVTLTSGGLQISKSLTSTDGRELTIQMTAPPTASDVTVTLGTQIADEAGNPLAAASWTLDCPEWVNLASPVFSVPASSGGAVMELALVVAPDGKPTMAISGADGRAPTGASGQVYRWNGSRWDVLSGTLTAPTGMIYEVTLDGENRPLIARTKFAGTSRIDVDRWDGSDWTSLGNAAYSGANTFLFHRSALRVDASGSPFIVYESEGSVYAKHRVASTWTSVDAGTIFTLAGGSISDVEAMVGPGDVLRASWKASDPVTGEATVHTWQAGSTPRDCFPLPALATGLSFGSTRMDPTRYHPAVIEMDRTTAITKIRVRQYGSLVITGCLGSDHWYRLGGLDPLNVSTTESAGSSSLVFDEAGRAVVAWGEGGSLFVKRWSGTSWQRLGTSSIDSALGATQHSPVLAVGPGGDILIAYVSVTTGIYARTVSVKRYNR